MEHENLNTEQNPPLQQTAVMCGFCRDCKFAKPDFEFEQLIICENPNLKLSAVFTMEGCQFSVEPDFGCVQFENRT